MAYHKVGDIVVVRNDLKYPYKYKEKIRTGKIKTNSVGICIDSEGQMIKYCGRKFIIGTVCHLIEGETGYELIDYSTGHAIAWVLDR